MKPTQDSLDDLIAAALHGDLSPEERAQFDARLQKDPAARAAYQEARLMDQALDKNFKGAQPDSSFEQRMVSGVRRKIKDSDHSETAWESALVLWGFVSGFFRGFTRLFAGRKRWEYGVMLGAASVVLVLAIYSVGSQQRAAMMNLNAQRADMANSMAMLKNTQTVNDRTPIVAAGATTAFAGPWNLSGANTYTGTTTINAGTAGAQSGLASTNYISVDKELADDDIRTSQFANRGAVNVSGSVTLPTQGTVPTDPGAISNSGSIAFGGVGAGAGGGDEKAEGATGQPTFGGNLSSTNGNDAEKAKFDAQAQQNLQYAQDQLAQLKKDGSKNLELLTVESGTRELKAVHAPQAEAALDAADADQPDAVAAAEQAAPAAPPPPSGYADGTPVAAPTAPESIDQLPGSLGFNQNPAQATPGTAPTTSPKPAPEADVDPGRKLIRNAQLELEVQSFQVAMDEITKMTRDAGGYIDTSNSQRGGNGKLQGTIVAKVLPRNLDDFLLRLRDLGEVKGQSVSTDDVTKDYFDTQARLVNSQKMEIQLQDLLKRENSKVTDLLQVERELSRVRGDIEQMQGQLKLYDFQVQFATVTMQVHEKDLNQTAAYLLKENDNFSLFATDVESTFQQARHAAEDCKAQILVATLNHNSGSNVDAQLVVSVPPDQIDGFLAQIRTMGRVDNFTRDTKRVAQDGGDSDQPADESKTEKDKVLVNIAIKSDDESRKQVALTVVTNAVDDALDKAKDVGLANAGEILGSSLNKAQEGQSTAQLSLRVPGKNYKTVIAALKALGRTAAFQLQRDDANSGPGVANDDAPVIISLSLTDDETPLQETEIRVLASDVDAQEQEIRATASSTSVDVKASSFQRDPNGAELALMTFRMPMSKYAGFIDSLQKLGKVESLTVRRVDRPDQARADDDIPVEIDLQLHKEGDIIPEDHGLMATLKGTFGEGASALFGSVQVIGVIIAFLAPWAVVLIIVAWIGRRIYLWRKK